MNKEKEIKRIQTALGCSYAEAVEVWECDNSEIDTPEQEELTKKAKDIKNYTQSEKAFKKGRNKERKVDTEKLSILQEVEKSLIEYKATKISINKEVEINFSVNNEDYTLKLIKHRRKEKLL
jgi:hypothetical protein